MRLKDFSIGMKDCEIIVSDGRGKIWGSIDKALDENQNSFIHRIRICPNGVIFITLESHLYCHLCLKVIYHKKENIEETNVVKICDNKYEAKSFCDKQNIIEEYENDDEHLYYYSQEREILS